MLEIGGGVLLTVRRLVVPAAALLAATMVVAITASGVGHGDVIPSLTLAPALLVVMVYLLARSLRADRRAGSAGTTPVPEARADARPAGIP